MQATAANQIIPAMEFIAETLLTLVQTVNGSCVMVSNMREMWQLASEDSQKPLIYVCYGGESAWSSNANISALTYRVSRNWIIGIKQGRGYTSDRGYSLTNFLPFVELVRDTIRTMIGVSQDNGNDFASIEPWSLGTQIIDGYILRFSTKNDLPQILTQPD
jgi:hypothetical protein